MIRGKCFTNLDEFHTVDWPESFVAIPHIGDRVEGRRAGNPASQPTLRVVGVTHRMVKTHDGARGPVWEPQILVELHR